ncbi:MAG TPA: hypothetical protein VMT35_00950 [Ignavibacteriaceae bacterium]|nr:hypothetical protein [Ignavibacteriaceae bacterium]
MKYKSLLLILYILFCKQLSAQGEAALPFLNFQQSPMLKGAGEIGVSIPSDLSSGFYYNPAILGFSSLRNHISPFYSWTDFGESYFFSGISSYSFGLNAGYNLKKNENDLPLSLGFGYIHQTLDFNANSDNDIDNYDAFEGVSFGAGYDYFLLFNLGFSAKYYHSVMSDQVTESEVHSAKTSGIALDFGALITVPISKLVLNKGFSVGENTFIKPLCNFSLGYSVSNIGNKVYYVDPAQADPLPRTARLGYTFDIGAALAYNGGEINLVEYSFTAEAEDLLIETIPVTELNGNFYDTFYEQGYQGFLGDISIGKNLIDLEGDNNVVIHKGHIFKLLETVFYATGRYGYGHLTPGIETEGIGISSEGFLKFLSCKTDNETVKYITDHLIIDYYHATVGGNFFGMKHTYQEISLKMNNVIF